MPYKDPTVRKLYHKAYSAVHYLAHKEKYIQAVRDRRARLKKESEDQQWFHEVRLQIKAGHNPLVTEAERDRWWELEHERMRGKMGTAEAVC